VFFGILVLYFVLYSPSYRLKKAYHDGEFTPAPSESPTNATEDQPSSPPQPSDGDPADRFDYKPDHHSFRSREDWYFEVSPYKVFNPLGPKPENIIILSAGDGGGNNAEIPDLLDNVSQNRQEYCDYQGYTCIFTNITKYDIEGSHAV
jgi:galactosyl transferase GMA12/MNN10 family